jgi:glycerol-3-phosphate dehydrogenase
MLFRSFYCLATVKSFGVAGSGQMGTGIAIVANRIAKLPVIIFDSNPVSLKKSKEFVNEWLRKEQGKNRITSEEITEFNSRLSFTEDINHFKERDVDFAVEVSQSISRLSSRISMSNSRSSQLWIRFSNRKPLLQAIPHPSPSRNSPTPQKDRLKSSACIS